MTSPTSRVGTIGELETTKWLLQNDFEVFKEVTGSSGIDLIALKHQKCYRIQVKTSKAKENGSVTFECRHQHDSKQRYVGDEFDILALYVIDRNLLLFITMNQLQTCKSSLTVRLDEPKNNAFKGIHLVNEFLNFPL